MIILLRMLALLLILLIGPVASSSLTELQIEATVSRVLGELSVSEKARQLDIFRTADMLSNGKVNMTKAAEVNLLSDRAARAIRWREWLLIRREVELSKI